MDSSDTDQENMPTRSKSRVASYNEVFNEAGFGVWQYFLLMQCGWANASDAIEIMCVSFIVPSVRDSMHVSHASLSGLMIVLFLGMMIGGYLWGSLADTYGRKSVIIVSLVVNATFGSLSAVCRTYWLLLLFRFLSGVGVGGSLPVCFAYFSEFQPTKVRGAMISALATCWMAGNLLVAGLAWGVLPESHNLSYISPYGETWRLFVIICTLPSLSSAFFFYYMPESPKYLFEKGKWYESLDVLQTMYRWNIQRVTKVPFPFSGLIKEERNDSILQSEFSENASENESLLATEAISRPIPRRNVRYLYEIVKRNLKTFYHQMQNVYSAEHGRRANSIFLTLIFIFVAFGGYGMAMWMPVLMERTERYNGSPCRGEPIDIPIDSATNDTSNMYFDVFVGAAAQLPGNFITILLMDRVGAKFFLIFSLFASALCTLAFWLVTSKTQVIIMFALFSAVSTMVWNCTDVLTVEMYPTNIRSSATGLLTGISRLGSISGNLVFGLFMDLNCSVPLLTTFVVFSLAGIVSMKLPNTRHIALL